MQYAQLGQSSLMISRIGFGCMSLEAKSENISDLIDKAIESGINYFDTADLYEKGLNEELLGKALRGKREKVIIATKVGNQLRADGSGWDWNPSRTHILESVEKSLVRLQTDCIDLYQLHGGTTEDPIDETIEAFELLKRQGKIRYYGISSIRPNVIREYIKRSNIVSVMMQYSILDRRPEEECLELLHKNKIGVLARGVLAKGLLAGKPSASYLNQSVDEIKGIIEMVKEITGNNRKNSSTAIQFVIQHQAITSAVIGIRTIDQLEEAIEGFISSPIPGEELLKLRHSIPLNYYDAHR